MTIEELQYKLSKLGERYGETCKITGGFGTGTDFTDFKVLVAPEFREIHLLFYRKEND